MWTITRRWGERAFIFFAKGDTVIDPAQIKADSIALLREWGIPAVDHLPTIEAETELSPQSAAAVARRSVILNHVAGIGFGGDARKLSDAVNRWGLMPYASAIESDMFSRSTHTDQEKINATWLVESLQSFAWCLGLADLEVFQHCDDNLASRFPAPYADPSEFVSTAALRPFEEIYRQADLHYRLHWEARNAQLTGAHFPVSEGFVRERRKALDWVIGVEPDWDEVPGDT
jgi:hypothetical protein